MSNKTRSAQLSNSTQLNSEAKYCIKAKYAQDIHFLTKYYLYENFEKFFVFEYFHFYNKIISNIILVC